MGQFIPTSHPWWRFDTYVSGCDMQWVYTLGLPDDAPPASALPVQPEALRQIQRFGTIQNDSDIFFHSGIDLSPIEGETMDVYAIAPGVITEIITDTKQGYDAKEGARNFKIVMYISKEIGVIYHFEAALDNDTGEALSLRDVRKLIKVRQGQKVDAGDIIGQLPFRKYETHLHFTIAKDAREGDNIPCPLTYFTEEKANEFNELYGNVYTYDSTHDICGNEY